MPNGGRVKRCTKTLHLYCVGLIAEVDRWSDGLGGETTRRHVSRSLRADAAQRMPVGACCEAYVSVHQVIIDGRCAFTRKQTGPHARARHFSSSRRVKPSITSLVRSATGAGAAAAPPRGAAAISSSHIRLARRPSSTTIFDYI